MGGEGVGGGAPSRQRGASGPLSARSEGVPRSAPGEPPGAPPRGAPPPPPPLAPPAPGRLLRAPRLCMLWRGGWGAGGAAGGGCYAPGGAALGEARARAGARVHGARLTGPGLRCPPSPPAGTFQFLSLAPLGEARGQRLRTFF